MGLAFLFNFKLKPKPYDMNKLLFLLFSLFFSNFVFSQVPGIKWTKYIRPTFSEGDFIFESQRTDDGGYIVAGIDTSYNYSRNNLIYSKYAVGRAWIAKLDSGGAFIWSRTTNRVDPHTSGFLSVCTTSSGLNVAAGHGNTSSSNPSNFYIAAYNSTGILQWDTLYGGAGIDRAYNIQSTSDGGFIAAGFTQSNDGQVSGNHSPGIADIWVVKFDAARTIQWQKCYGGSGADTAYSILQTSDNGYIVAGVSASSNGDLTGNNGLADAWVFKIDNAGNIEWQRNIGGADNEALKNITINSDNSYTLTGYTRSASVLDNGLKGQTDLWVITISGTNGSTIWSKGFGGSSDDHGYSIKRTFGNGFLVGGYTESSNGDITNQSGRADAWLLNLENDGSLIWQKTIGTSKDEFAMTVHNADADFAITGFATPVISQSFFDSTDGYIARLGNANFIKGTLFYDVNTNGIKDPGEDGFDLANVKAVKVGYQQIAIPSNGEFLMIVDTGTYTTSVILQSPYYTVVPFSHVSSFTTYFNTDSFSFAVQPLPAIKDLVINAIPLSVARPGFNVSYKIFYKNVGTATVATGEVLFKKDSRLDFVSSVPAISSSNGDTLKWSYSNLQSLDSSSITVKFLVQAPPQVNIGNTLTSIGIITPVAGDQTPLDDTVVVKQIVTGSFDPNDKYEKNEGKVPPAYVSDGKYLDYLVRFQNLGTDTAFNIVILDTLSAKLDLSSLQVIATSHSYKVTLTDNILKWTFDDIKLPHSAINEPASHGYIAYRIIPFNSVALGDTIHNTASIYFDFNLPVQTNNAFTAVAEDVVLPLKLLSFSGVYRNDKSTLHWKTSDEFNIDKFEIQRSFTGTNFNSIGYVLPQGRMNSTTQYEFVDNLANVSANTIFYRLMIKEKDSKTSYSQVLLFRKKTDAVHSISINPNPVRGNAVVNINYSKQTDIELRVIDVNGKTLIKQKNQLSQGNNSIIINGVDRLQAGFYIVQALTGNDKLTTSFVLTK